ncbi:hypothetical protein BGZ83_010317 [Gryganskiella cystojenkinii]|nr:hypothetical protein BGZ83_010317 [Gryganskiella cystojenkinii]
MRLFSFSDKRSPNRMTSSATSASSSFFTTLLVFTTLVSFLSANNNLFVEAGPGTGFCGDCQTFANALTPCSVTFGRTDIEINGTYSPPVAAAKCICSDVMQRVLWTCAKCEANAGFDSHSPPPQAYHTTCISWGQSIQDWNAPYAGVVAPGTVTTPLTSTNPPPNPNTSAGTNPTTASIGGSSTSSSGTANPSGSSNPSNQTSDGPSGPSGTAIGISVGIIGVALVAGVVAVAMMKRRRRRRTPLELDGTYVGLDDTWEKQQAAAARPVSPPMAPAPIASGASPSMGARLARPSPFESRPGGGGSVVGGYEPQYDRYNGGYGQPAQGYDNYGHGGYDPNYNQGGYGNQHHDYGYDQQIPTSAAPNYHPGKGGEGGQYL